MGGGFAARKKKKANKAALIRTGITGEEQIKRTQLISTDLICRPSWSNPQKSAWMGDYGGGKDKWMQCCFWGFVFRLVFLFKVFQMTQTRTRAHTHTHTHTHRLRVTALSTRTIHGLRIAAVIRLIGFLRKDQESIATDGGTPNQISHIFRDGCLQLALKPLKRPELRRWREGRRKGRGEGDRGNL